MLAKKYLPLVILIALIIVAFWVSPSLWHILIKGPAPQSSFEKFDSLFAGNRYARFPFGHYDNFRLMSVGGGQNILMAFFQLPQSVKDAETVFRKYLDDNKYTAVWEKEIANGVKLGGTINEQPLLIEITKVSDGISGVTVTFREKYLIETLSYGKLPSNFPADIPVEYNVLIIQNDSVRINNKTQGTFVIDSANTGDENFETYLNYFGGNGWTVINRRNDPKEAVKSIFASSKNGSMVVNITPGRSPGTSIVSLTLIPLSQ